MKRNDIIAAVLVILATIGTIIGILEIEKHRRGKFFTVELIARVPENGNWYPRHITVSYGQEVKIYIRNIETVSHGFALPDFDVLVPEIKAGEVMVVQFKADKKGTFPFMCAMWCSEQHMQMTGKLTVE